MKIPALVLLVFLSACVLAADKPRYDWSAFPESKISEEIAAACDALAEDLKDKSCLVTPLLCSKSAINPAGCEATLQLALLAELTKRGVKIVDDKPMREKMPKPDANGKVTPPQFTEKIIAKFAELCSADRVLLGTCRVDGKSTLDVYLHDGKDGKRISKAQRSFSGKELTIEALTPAISRSLVTWVESRKGQKIDRGECWDVAACGLKAVGAREAHGYDFGTPLPVGATPLPGDIVQFENANLGGAVIAHHTVVVYEVKGPGQVTVLHQNWMGGAESGRHVDTRAYDFTRLTSGQILIYRPIATPR